MDDVTIARAIHVLAAIHWMGGVAFVTAVILPSAADIAEPAHRLAFFESVERRFSAQVKVSIPLAGLSGIYMAERLDVWRRFIEPEGWWLAAMVLLWLLFMAMLFIVEPFLLRDRFHRRATADPDGTFRLMRRAHWILLLAGAVVAASGVLGAHGLLS
jgi:uncharacterized membrane protein